MRQTLFHIPAELFGVPTLGCGWLLGLWVIVAFFFAWGTYRHDGMWPALISLVMYLLLGGVVLGFALPHLEEHVMDGAAVRNLGLPVRGYGVAMFLAVSAGVALAMRRTGFPVVCLVIGFLLGSMLETSLRQSMLLYKSDLWVIFESPIALGFLILTLFVLVRAAIKR